MQNRNLIFITCQPSDMYFLWQLDLQLNNLRELGYSDKYHGLVFIPNDRIELGIPDKWKALEEKYPEAKISYFFDTDNFLDKVIRRVNYIPLLRLFCLEKYFAANPELENDAIFYYDSDVLFTREFPFEKFIDDDICYLSDTAGYLNGAYFDSKKYAVLDTRKESYDREDVLARCASFADITKEIVYSNNDKTGGAQYLLKNINSQFWKDCIETCKKVRTYLMLEINPYYFGSEDNGYQSWCADMWAVLWNLWKRDYKTETPKEFDFAWGTDPIEKLNTMYLYHNAGITNVKMNLNGEDVVVFYKGKYVNNDTSPFNEREYLEQVDKKYCNSFYATELLKIQDPIF